MTTTPPGSFPEYRPEADPPPAYSPPPAYPPPDQPAYQAPPAYPPPDQPAYQAPPAYPPPAPPAYSPPTQPPAPGRHQAGPAVDETPWGATSAPQYGATPPVDPATLPYGGVPGLVVPPNYAVYLSQTRREVGVVGLVLTLIGAALVVVSFVALDWLSGGDGFGDTLKVKFSDLHDLSGHDSPTLSRLYFSWLGWTLLAAVVVFGVLGNLAIRSHPLWRVLGILTGLAGAACTFFAIYGNGTSLSDVAKYGDIGFWLAIGAFFLAAIGAVIGPRRVRG
jgi:hypothetical protein